MEPKSVVYTALIGTDEKLQELRFSPRGNFDYVCFTDNPNLRSASWRIVQVSPRIPGDSSRSSRHIKLTGAEELSGYDKWLWIDNRISLTKSPEEIFDFLKGDRVLGLSPHDHRASVSEEIAAVLRFAKDHPFRVREAELMLKAQSPAVLGQRPYNGTMILRKNCAQVDELMQLWWELILRYSKRDQLSFNYAIELTGLKPFSLPFEISGSAHHRYVPGSELRSSEKGWKNNAVPSLVRLLVDLTLGARTIRGIRRLPHQIRELGSGR
ncbi:DUF616 domain-containing protein [Pontimonas sp.]|nr:DUF616 domain-containing protein [Pontimonas sp.]